MKTTLPAGSKFKSGPTSNACHLARKPNVDHGGSVKCGAPRLGPGGSDALTVAWRAPKDPFGIKDVPNLDIAAVYRTGGRRARDDDEVLTSGELTDTSIAASNTYAGPASPTVGHTMAFEVKADANAGALFKPTFKFHVPAGARFRGTDVPNCNHPTGTGGVTVTCHVPYSDDSDYSSTFRIKPTRSGPKTTKFTARAANAPAESDSETSPAVAP